MVAHCLIFHLTFWYIMQSHDWLIQWKFSLLSLCSSNPSIPDNTDNCICVLPVIPECLYVNSCTLWICTYPPLFIHKVVYYIHTPLFLALSFNISWSLLSYKCTEASLLVRAAHYNIICYTVNYFNTPLLKDI